MNRPSSTSRTAPVEGSPIALAASAYVFAVVMMGTTLPTPLYPEFAARFGFGDTQTTVLFAVYACGVLAALVLFGRISELVGRKPLLAAGIALTLASAIVFLIGSPLWLIYIGRVLSGLAAGILTATGTVTVLENAPTGRGVLAAAAATAANIGGLGLGILMAGLLGEFAPRPLWTPFLVHAVLTVLAGAALLAVNDGTRRARGEHSATFRLQLPAIPPEARRMFAASWIGGFASFAMCGLYSALVPGFMHTELHITSSAVIGATIFAVFGASAITQICLRSLPDRTLILAGAILLAVGMAAFVGALAADSLALLIASSLVSGAAHGMLFMTGMRAVNAASRRENRTGATTSFFVSAYVAISVPPILAGVLSRGIGLVGASAVFGAAIAALSLVELLYLRRFSSERP
ncbi:MFS transporter [Dietzia sp.]|uniref:MFS transporter n=1 Tax=Dietzia sp. TaxID=1871616 RepID=UPI002FD978B9